jgi:peroxiredoxin
LGIVQTFTEQMGLTYPVLFDEDGAVLAKYDAGKSSTNSVYPQDWIIGVDGTVRYVNRNYEPIEMMAIIDAELEKAAAP